MAFRIPDDMTAETWRHSRGLEHYLKTIVCISLYTVFCYTPCNQTFRNRVAFEGSAYFKLPNFIKRKHLMRIWNTGSTSNEDDTRYKWISKPKTSRNISWLDLLNIHFYFLKKVVPCCLLWFNNDGSTIRKHETSYCGRFAVGMRYSAWLYVGTNCTIIEIYNMCVCDKIILTLEFHSRPIHFVNTKVNKAITFLIKS